MTHNAEHSGATFSRNEKVGILIFGWEIWGLLKRRIKNFICRDDEEELINEYNK